MSRRRICVIGAGTAGLVATKTAIQEGNGAEVVCYERSASLGGIWWYRPDETEQTTVMEFTVTNTSKEMSSFSDFPASPELPVYLPHKQMLEYLASYADHFGVTECIRFNHNVHKVEKKSNGKWRVTVEDRAEPTSRPIDEEFDAVMVCIGHHSIPTMPEFRDQKLFNGRIIHSKRYKNSDGYRGKNVLVVGFGNSGADVAVSLAGLANQVYTSVRRGTWMIPSHFSGDPADFHLNRRVLSVLPSFVADFYANKKLEDYFDPNLIGFTPEHPATSQQLTTNDYLPKAFLSKQIILKPPISHFTATGVVFQGSDEEVPIDEVIVATGYKPDIPFIDNRFYGKKNDHGNIERLLLYKGLYSLIDDSIAFLSMVEAAGNLGQMFEIQARHAMAVFNGNVKLPATQEERLEEVERDIAETKARYLGDSDRHAAMVNKMKYMDMLGAEIGIVPDWWALLKQDPWLTLVCFCGPWLPYQYRLVGPYKWEGARNAIFSAKTNQFAALKPNPRLHRTAPENIVVAKRYIYKAICLILFVFLLMCVLD